MNPFYRKINCLSIRNCGIICTVHLKALVEKLSLNHSLSKEEYAYLITHRDAETALDLAERALCEKRKIYGDDIYVRGLIEFTNYCRNNCLYCGIRRANTECERYRLSEEEILLCADEGYSLGYRTFVLQGGEDSYFTDEILCSIVKKIRQRYPDCAVTLSVGERSKESYRRFFEAGAERYLLRHETASEEHYKKLHPSEMSFSARVKCLYDLREAGFAVGAGFMVGSPFQTAENIALDLKFIEEFKPEMCGIGPFIPHEKTPFCKEPAGSVELTCFLLSVIRMIHPHVLLPATTALATLAPDGREKGILCGANVIMPNLSPVAVRKKYALYDGKVCTGEESAQCRRCIDRRIESIGFKVVTDRGDYK
ncbi:MAG: [FeFe] hydrogenase H-cluster radical SAM maturase HydE [Treponema sp.]|nr:[FeFe] hydrogenase H-cluster radical SAM maturase HydE [Treponema sp.]